MSIRIPIDPASLPIVRRMNPGRIATHQKENFEQDPEPKVLRLLGADGAYFNVRLDSVTNLRAGLNRSY